MASSKAHATLIHYTKQAMHDFNMIEKGDRVMVCVSGGKDSYSLLSVLNHIRIESNFSFEIMAFTLDQMQPGWNDSQMRAWMHERKIPFEIISQNTYQIVKDKIPEGKTYCSLCSRLRRGIIYRYAREQGFDKIALGHHRDDLIETLMMSICYNGQIKSMPPKLRSDDGTNIVIRPFAFCKEKDIIAYANEQQFPIIPCNLCGSQKNLTRQKIKRLIKSLSDENPKIPSNMLRALSNVQVSQLMDHNLWDFKSLSVEEGQLEDL